MSTLVFRPSARFFSRFSPLGGTPLTGSWSTERTQRYEYYHCRSCGEVRISKERLETAFVALLERLQPRM